MYLIMIEISNRLYLLHDVDILSTAKQSVESVDRRKMLLHSSSRCARGFVISAEIYFHLLGRPSFRIIPFSPQVLPRDHLLAGHFSSLPILIVASLTPSDENFSLSIRCFRGDELTKKLQEEKRKYKVKRIIETFEWTPLRRGCDLRSQHR